MGKYTIHGSYGLEGCLCFGGKDGLLAVLWNIAHSLPIPGGATQRFFYFHPENLGKMIPILTSIFFKGVGSTTN